MLEVIAIAAVIAFLAAFAAWKWRSPARVRFLDGLDPTRVSDEFPTHNWTPSALRVLGTAKALAAPGKIMPWHLLLSMEVNVSVARNVLCRLRLQPSEVLRFDFPVGYEPTIQLNYPDFSPELLVAINKRVAAEARALSSSYCGTEHLLLMLARIGVPGVPLDYAQVRDYVLDELDPRSSRKT